ncbi:hypothetical protein TNCT_642991 [Trichonephila clavata]|uniref:Uncharacterized protein n=1 Tax=Trichonephila clavata TaxID=2740835 RepID=A0A8X6HG96_TRICU|nr:hypothetical protein TNCT_642991 [Trichonephila clavata]
MTVCRDKNQCPSSPPWSRKMLTDNPRSCPVYRGPDVNEPPSLDDWLGRIFVKFEVPQGAVLRIDCGA